MKAVTLQFILIAFFVQCAFSQLHHTGPMSYPDAIRLRMPHTTSYPPLRTDMPLDVLLGYVYFDSIIRSMDDSSGMQDSVINSLSLSDTIRRGIAMLYKMRDFDPIAFFQMLDLPPRLPQYHNSNPPALVDAFMAKYTSLVPNGRLIFGLCNADYILQIHVDDTTDVTDTLDPYPNKSVWVCGKITDVLKGHRWLPHFDTAYRTAKVKTIASSADSSFCFGYFLHWQESIVSPNFTFNPNTLYGMDGKPWVKAGKDYIVFCTYTGLGRDGLSANESLIGKEGLPVYATLGSGLLGSTSLGIYPVSEGIVEDPNDDFGFGIGLTSEAFKSNLRQILHSITNP